MSMEYQLVGAPVIFPQACFCGSQTGPLVDTFVTTAGARLYVCSLCATRITRALGLSKGKRMSELLNSGALLDEMRVTLADREKLIEEQLAELAARARRVEALETLLQHERDVQRTSRALLESINEQSKQLLMSAS